jgi:protein phosphatase
MGWWWLAGFWLGAMALVAGLSMMLFDRFEEGGVVTGIGAFTIILLGLQALKLRRPFRRRHDDRTVAARPHRTAVAQPSEQLLQTLMGMEMQLRRAAQEEEWSVDWEAHQQAFSSMTAAQDQRRYARGVRDSARAIDLLMSDLPRRRAMAAGAMAASNGLR